MIGGELGRPSPAPTPPALPGYRELAWMMFMQPVALERRLKAAGVEHPDEPAWKLLVERGPKMGIHREYVQRMWLLLGLITGAAGLTIGSLLCLFACDASDVLVFLGVGAILGVAVTVALGGGRRGVGANALGATVGLAVGGLVASTQRFLGMQHADIGAARIASGVLLGMLAGLTGRLILSAVNLAGFGVMSLVPGRVFGSVTRHMASVASLVGGRLIVVLVIGAGVGWSLRSPSFSPIPALWVVSVLAVVALPRLFVYPFEALNSGVLYYRERLRGTPTLTQSPVLVHELSYLPYPWLARHMLYVADRDPALVRRVLDACNVAPGQHEIGRTVLSCLQARELESLARRRDFRAAMDLAGPHWLPGRAAGAPPLLIRFSELGRLLAQAEGSAPHARLHHLNQADQALRALEQDILADDSPLGRALRLTLPTWREVIAKLLPKAQRDADSTLRNPFRLRALDPTAGGGEEVFRGRDALVREIRSLLVDEEHGSTLAVLGPRRCGKTSLLKMLPKFLPDALCVFFDAQNNPVSSPAKFFVALSARMHEAAGDRLILPPLHEGASFDEGCAWFQSLEETADDGRIVICLDEVERLEELYAGHARDVERLLGLFRATMQHRDKVRLLISAKAPFEAMGERWNDHFISAQEIWLDHLDEPASIALLTRPTRDFPPDVVPGEVARHIFDRTGGQPFLLQAYGSHLISLLNDQRRWRARLDDIAAVEDKVLTRWRTYFANILDEAPPEAKRALEELAGERRVELAPNTRRWLRHRRLLAVDDGLRIPVLGRWIRDYWLQS